MERKKIKKWSIILCIIIVVLIIAGIIVWRIFSSAMSGGTVSDTITEDMLDEAKANFTVEEYTDEQTGLSVSYNIFIPDGYDDTKTYPLMVFIADSSSVGNYVSVPLTRNAGGAVWATDVEQKKHPSFVVVPCYPEGILDDHDTYTMTEYVEFTARMIEAIEGKYNIDTSKVYGCGQSMGAMTTMYLAANHPDLYTAILIVDGQWKIDELEGLKNTTFTYIVAGGDDKAFTGQTEVKEMFDAAGIAYGELKDLDAQDDVSELNFVAKDMYEQGYKQNFITWTAGSVGSSMGSEHMASFPYGFKIDTVRDWIYSQSTIDKTTAEVIQ